MNPIIWVAKPDKSGWNATRPRDLGDYSFVVTKEDSAAGVPAVLKVRDTYTKDPKARARMVIGEFHFNTSKEIKELINHLLAEFNSFGAGTSQDQLRAEFLERLMEKSLPAHNNYYVNPTTGMRVNSVVSGTVTSGPVHIGELAEEVMDNAVANSGQWVPYSSVLEEHVRTGMVEAIADVQEVVKPVFDPSTWAPGQPVPAGYMVRDNRLVQLTWPS